jgi:RimJ/RimL family protein N-acetyltransferase
MTDPTDALKSFQSEFERKQLTLHRGELDSTLWVHLDRANGEPRFSYATNDGKTVTGLVIFVPSDPVNGEPCFNIGYAVPEAYRGHGRAKALVVAGIAELKNGLSRNGISKFHVEAIVGADNAASKRVAAEAISSSPTEITDSVSGEPAFHYITEVNSK